MLFFNILTLFSLVYLAHCGEMSNFAFVIELERHIEILLLDNDCVIVPGLGGFVAHYIDACYDGRDCLFLPPLRTLGFNPKLNMNDSLLAQSYVEAYDISYPEALTRIDSEVDELKQTLEKDGCFELEDIGILSINGDGNYEFEPCESGILTPDLYGLAGVQVERLTTDEKQLQSVATVDLPVCASCKPTSIIEEKADAEGENAEIVTLCGTKLEGGFDDCNDDAGKTIQIKVSVLRNVLAVACAVVAFFLLSTPINTEVYENGLKQSAIVNGLLYNLVPNDGGSQELNISGALRAESVVKEKASPVNTKAAENVQSHMELDKKQLSVPADKSGYCIVLACRIKKSNADEFVYKLHSEGYADARVIGKAGSSLKVVYGCYSSEAEAYAKLNSLREVEMFKEAWIYYIK